MAVKCPYCDVIIESLKYDAAFSEVVSGHEWGTCDVDGDNQDKNDSETTDYNDYEQGDVEYECPVCNHEIPNLDDLIETDGTIEPEKENPNKLGNFPKREGCK